MTESFTNKLIDFSVVITLLYFKIFSNFIFINFQYTRIKHARCLAGVISIGAANCIGQTPVGDEAIAS